MRWLVLAGALVLDPAMSYADHRSCGGGGSSGGGGGGRSTGTFYGGYRGAAAATSGPSEVGGCIDDTDVVGYRHCTKFGVWASNMRLPRMFVEVGSNVRRFGSLLSGRDGTVTHGAETFSYRTIMPSSDTRSDVAMSSAIRFGVGLPHHLYTGVEFEVGSLVAPAAATTEMTSTGSFGSPDLTQGNGLLLGALGVAGVRGDMQVGALALEAAGGVRSVSYQFASTYHECETSTTVEITRAIVEARARAELWAGPWFTLGATLGSNVLAKNDWMAGLYLGIHSRAYAGAR